MSDIADAALKIPGVAATEGAITGALATEEDLPIKDYDKRSAEDIARKLKGFSQRELRKIDAYERKNDNRATITAKIAKLTGDEPWSGYDELSAEGEVSRARLVGALAGSRFGEQQVLRRPQSLGCRKIASQGFV